MSLDKLFAKIDSYEDDVVELQREMVAIPALAPNYDAPAEQTGEAKKVAYLKRYLKDHGFTDFVDIEAPDDRVPGGIRPSLVARVKGKSSEKTVWVMGHTDVVPAGDMSKWKTDPFELTVDGDRIYGRGVEDNHQGVVAGILAARAFMETGEKPAYDLAILMVADEECGSEYGIQYVLKNGNPFKPSDLIFVPDGGAPDGSEIEVAEKSIMWVRVHTTGVQAHASMPDKGVNALRAGANLVVALDELHSIFSLRDSVFAPPMSTFEPTKKDANVPNINTIPGEDIFFLDCRIMPNYPLDDVEKEIRRICDAVAKKFKVKVDISFEQREEAAPATSSDAPIVGRISKAVKEICGIEARAVGIGGGTVAAYLRREGLPCVVWSTMDETMHGPNENARISNILTDAKVVAHVAAHE
jgi:succinyl-diaminopimelate desuccinylase